MKHSVLQQFATIHEDSASLFDAKLNEMVQKLRNYGPVVKYSEQIPFYAHITYGVSEITPETVAEASELSGVSFVCSQCPFFKPVLRDDGEIDKRCKYGDCEYTELGRTFKDQPACDKLYDIIKDGDVNLVFKEG